jgi:hypothetical protein
MTNYLYYGDNLDVLAKDPRRVRRPRLPRPALQLEPLLQRAVPAAQRRRGSQAQIEAFDDTWTWSHEAEQQYLELVIRRGASEGGGRHRGDAEARR